MEHDLTRGNVLKTIAVFALPYMLSYFLQMLYGMADLYMMGSLLKARVFVQEVSLLMRMEAVLRSMDG